MFGALGLELARRCGDGDADAQRTFVDRFGSLVYSVCAHSGLVGADRDDRDEDRRVSRAMAQLPQRERAVLLAYYLGEMSVTEIAAAFGVPENTVKTRLDRGRLALRKELVGS